MNTPNKITLSRIIMIPLFMFFLLQRDSLGSRADLLALIIFGLAALTDAIDGYLARRDNLVTKFGKIADPLADKLLIASALISFTALGVISPWPVILIIGREMAVTGLRVVAASEGVIRSASHWGKAKTVTQILAVLSLIVSPALIALPEELPLVILWLAVAITLYSGYLYFKSADLQLFAG